MTTKKNQRKSCKLCGSPINAGLYRDDAVDLSKGAWFELDAGESLKILSECCINCFNEILHVSRGLDMNKTLRWGEQSEDLTIRAAATYAARLLKDRTKPSERKKKEVYTMFPEPASDRELVMLEAMIKASGMYLWAGKHNRDVTEGIQGLYGTSLFWKGSAHFRHLRKKYGIKGTVCSVYTKEQHAENWPNVPRGSIAFFIWRQFRDEVRGIERKLMTKKQNPAQEPVSACMGHYTCVWVRIYRAAHFRELVPIKERLTRFKWEMDRERREVA